MDDLKFTGERYLPTLDSPEISYEHWHRYLYAASLVQGGMVLDIACGEGYGSSLLARSAARVVGVDISPEAISHAQSRYAAANLEFKLGSVDKIPVPGHGLFDAVVSFETIEHLPIELQTAFLAEIRRLLKPDGLCLLSTPNKAVYSDQAGYCNEFHIKEFYVPEFRAFLERSFAHVHLLGQRIYPVSYLWSLDNRKSFLQEYRLTWSEQGFLPTDSEKSELYVLALCSDQPVVSDAASLLVDLSERIWRAKDPRIEQYLAALRERDIFIGNLKFKLHEKNRKIQSLEQALQSQAPAATAGPVLPFGPGPTPGPVLAQPAAEQVEVSIIIPVFNHLEHTQTCCQSLLQNTPPDLYEVVIVDNASTDGTTAFLESLSGDIQIIRNPENLGFVEACNQGARAATGKYLLFLNNDTAPQAGWLEAMLGMLQSDPAVGAVGAKLIYPDGRLQEAGGLIFSDGSGWNFGRGDNPEKPVYNRACEVDYCSGACLLVRRDAFERYGGFDLRYAPAYYEDADLCFGLRHQGYKIMYCPESRIVHFEGATAGTQLASGFKKYQAVNRDKFTAKWQEALAGQDPNPDRSRILPATADRSRLIRAGHTQDALNILVIDPTLPLYDRAAGSLRLFVILKILRQAGCDVTYIARNGLGHERYQQKLESMGIRVYASDPEKMAQLGYTLRTEPLDLPAILAQKKYHVAWLSFFHIAEQYLPDIRHHSPDTKIYIDTVDIHFLRETRQAELSQNTGLLCQAQETKRRELAVYAKADCLITVTAAEREFLQAYLPQTPMAVVPTIHDIQEDSPGFDLRSGLLYVGNFNHPPNPDAVQYFCRDIFPLVAAAIPGIKLYVVGDNPPSAVKALEREDIVITGYVSKLDLYLNMCRVSIAPLRFGAGMKGKIGEALGCGLPVVTTSIGAEGMDLESGEQVLIADTPETFAQSVVRLYTDKALWNTLRHQGRAHIENNFSPQAVARQLQEQLNLKPALRTELTSIILLTHNQWDYTRQCLESILASTSGPYEIIVVDNASTDQTLEELARFQAAAKPGACRACKVLGNQKNLGFAGGNNRGLLAAQGDFMLLLNNDLVVTSGWLGRLLGCARRREQIGLVGPMSNYVSGPQRVPVVGYDAATLAGLAAYAERFAQDRACQAMPYWRLAGFCLLIKRAVLDKIGGLDERFGLGNFEDDDYSVRARLAGFESWIAQDCFVHHFGSRTFIGANLDYQQSLLTNWEIFKRKWGMPEALGYGEAFDPSTLGNNVPPREYYCAYS